MPLSPRLVTLGYFGVPSTPSYAVNLSADATFKAAQKFAGGVVNLRQYRKGQKDGVTQTAIGLDYKNYYAPEDNTVTAWSAEDDTYFENFTNAFNSSTDGLLYSNAADNAANTFTTNFVIPPNRAWCIKFLLFEKMGEQAVQIISFTFHRWRVEIVDGSPEIMRTSANWTAAKQATLDALRNSEEQLSESDQAAVDALKLDIYEAGYNGSITSNKYDYTEGEGENKIKAGEWFEFTFVPEPRGILNIISDKADYATEVAEITATRQNGIVYPATPLVITTNGGAMFWQVGFPQFARIGSLKTAPFKWWNQTALDTLGMTFRGQSDQSSPGTSLNFSLDAIPDSIAYQVSASLASDGRYTPFIYSQEGFVAAGDRTGSDAQTWDSDAVSDFADNGTPIKTMTPQYEGEMIRRCATFEIRDIDGRLDLPDLKQKYLHDHIVSAELSGDPFITRGIVKSAQLGYAAQATANVTEAATCNRWTSLTVEVADQWAVMESDLMMDCPKGDGLHLGAYLRLILKGAGVKDSEMTGISPTFGRVLPSAAPGEDFLITPSPETSRADWLQTMMNDWGMGAWFYISAAGIWTLSVPNETIQADFTHDAPYGGYRILEPLDIVRDYCDFYNWFCVEGAEIGGRRLRQTWTVQESIFAPGFVGYIGRYKRFPTIRNDALRTMSDVQWVLRSNVRAHARPGRFFNFPTNFHRHLVPGHFITADSVTCQLKRINGGSIDFNDDRMGVCAQEVIRVA